MTKIEQVAKALDVEIGEEFQVEGYKGVTFKFSDKLLYKWDDGVTFKVTSISFNDVLGKEIIKLPQKWKPKVGENYLTFDLSVEEGIRLSTWFDDNVDKNSLKHGAVFKTKEEADKAYQAVLKTLENL